MYETVSGNEKKGIALPDEKVNSERLQRQNKASTSHRGRIIAMITKGGLGPNLLRPKGEEA